MGLKFLNQKELKLLKDAFKKLDSDKSGEIEYDEIPKIFSDLNIKASDVRLIY